VDAECDISLDVDTSAFLRQYSHLRRKPTIVRYKQRKTHSQVVDVEQRGAGLSIDTKSKAHAQLSNPMTVYIDGPFGAPASNIFRAHHAVLIATGIGVTPFSAILQSIMHRFWAIKKECPKCSHTWTASEEMRQTMFNLSKVDFFWINRDQQSFEWFVQLLTQLELEQAERTGGERFLDMHMYITSALQRFDMRAVTLNLALDLLYEKVCTRTGIIEL
jgi:hypothetical protein